MKEDTVIYHELKEENWGYFRPGFYPMEESGVVPAMVCLSELPYQTEPNIQFVLVKMSCYLKEWEDALLISENDFEQITKRSRLKSEDANKKIQHFMKRFISKGYLPLTKVKSEVQFNPLH
jgi:hypothetical protein